MSRSPQLYLQPFCPRCGDREEWKEQTGSLLLSAPLSFRLGGFSRACSFDIQQPGCSHRESKETRLRGEQHSQGRRGHKYCGPRQKIFMSASRSVRFSCCSYGLSCLSCKPAVGEELCHPKLLSQRNSMGFLALLKSSWSFPLPITPLGCRTSSLLTKVTLNQGSVWEWLRFQLTNKDPMLGLLKWEVS